MWHQSSLDTSLAVVLPLEYDDLLWLPNDTISAAKNKKRIILDRQFKPVFVPDKNTFVNWWADNVYQGIESDNGQFKYLDEHGKQIGP